MKILHVTQYCHVNGMGGTERYILDLLLDLAKLGHECQVAWLVPRFEKEHFVDSYNISIHTLPGSMMRVDAPQPELARSVNQIFNEYDPDYVHFHTFGRSEALIARIARTRNLAYAFTYHSPAWTCRHEDLMRWNCDLCDGEVRTWRCSACKIHEHIGLSKTLGYVISGAMAPIGFLLDADRNINRRRRLAFIPDTIRFRNELREFLRNCKCVIACCEWAIPVLIRNGTEKNRIFLCPQGVSDEFGEVAKELNRLSHSADQDQITIGYVGRVAPTKGTHLLLDAFQYVSSSRVRLKIHGWREDDDEREYFKRIKMLASKDSRIELIPGLPIKQMMKAYLALDVLAIPSITRETGPLVLMEAISLGIPVWGSEMIGHPSILLKHGMFIRPNTVDSWAAAMNRLAKDGRAMLLPSEGEKKMRTMFDVATEMNEVYRHKYSIL